MFYRLRIRHKLALGLLLVGGIMALLLAGTIQGLNSYRQTIRTIDGRLNERKSAQWLQDKIEEVLHATRPEDDAQPNLGEILRRVQAARDALAAYEFFLNDTVLHQKHLETGYVERGFVNDLRDLLDEVERLAQRPPRLQLDIAPGAAPPTLAAELAPLRRKLGMSVVELRDVIDADLSRRIAQGKHEYTAALTAVIAISLLGFVLLVGLSRLAYRWIAYPVRDLQQKVVRVAQGQFDGRVEVQSGDEMQDLAEAFNHMSEKLNDMYRDLARQVNDRSRQLIRSERLAGVGYLAAGVAHEINNPLASISFCSEALQRRLRPVLAQHAGDPDVPMIENYLQMIEQEAFRCKDITQKLLEFSRVGERPRQMADLAELIQSVIDTVQHLQSYRGKRIDFAPAQRPHLQLNVPEMKSVVLNLVVNALESMEEGSVLTIGLSATDQHAVIEFRDQGCGMSAEVLENIFEPFFTRSRTGKGVGLGLSISHRIVTQHGGEIEADSAGPGQGSTFTLRLPLVATATTPEETPMPTALRQAA
ncbi:MAG TPA: HAMP domain-containing sensor histidine kinase [Gemmatales bacterium]|nr:HAMP domain-containing sensor histidine kinase [Gemmatales bacterium]